VSPQPLLLKNPCGDVKARDIDWIKNFSYTNTIEHSGMVIVDLAVAGSNPVIHPNVQRL
jgi:hypothetical protein